MTPLDYTIVDCRLHPEDRAEIERYLQRKAAPKGEPVEAVEAGATGTMPQACRDGRDLRMVILLMAGNILMLLILQLKRKKKL